MLVHLIELAFFCISTVPMVCGIIVAFAGMHDSLVGIAKLKTSRLRLVVWACF